MAWWEDEHNHLNLTLTQQREEQAGALIMMDRGRGDSQRVAGRGSRGQISRRVEESDGSMASSVTGQLDLN